MKFSSYKNYIVVFSGLLFLTVVGCSSDNPKLLSSSELLGEKPSIEKHIKIEDIHTNNYTLDEIIQHGEHVFVAILNTLDGKGRPASTGGGAKREPRIFPDNLNRISGPDSDSCAGCHNRPSPGGGGDNAANVFVLAQFEQFVDFSKQEHVVKGLEGIANERNTLGMFGSGFIELLAREMTEDLQLQKKQAVGKAIKQGILIEENLLTKNISFGKIRVTPFGKVDYSGVEGIDHDLVVKPFHQKGVVESLRVFTNAAMNHHHGIQPIEIFGENTDADGDGVINELTMGDVTALTIFQATLPAPHQIWPKDTYLNSVAKKGETLFSSLGCASCHVPKLPLENTMFSEPGPYNRYPNLSCSGTLKHEKRSSENKSDKTVGTGCKENGPCYCSESNIETPYNFDLLPFIKNFTRDEDGRLLVPVFTDLKRHAMGQQLNNEEREQADVPTDQWLTKKLWGFYSEPSYLHHGRASLISEAILAHGGESQSARDMFASLPGEDKNSLIEYLKTFIIN